MENQHRKISGYRELSQEEIDLMNEIKALGPQIEDMLEKIRLHVINQRQHAMDAKPNDVATLDRLTDATPERFVALAKTDFQTALMYLTRAVAQPTFF
jgi:hypothetical protein